jgi:hypothetical protein
MRAIRVVTVAAMVVVALTQFGCGRKAGEEFVGKWAKVSGNGSQDLVISRNGDGNDFYMADQVPNLAAESKADAIKTERIPATCVFHANRAAVLRQSEQAFHAKPSRHSTTKRALRTWRRGVSFFYSFPPSAVKLFRRLRIDSPESVKRCAL